ncbi:acyltransferase [Saccharospirillum sp. MSK14-1]|uniref:acyltransferase family protein n=1 Tax=Saccharospirillum sp. MSK14-1 TaxID=1897632 RepID=UPI000D390499|nr:acyltransferase family protein [Saccharospirillum sp. MSK14-1]PTY35983.1 acyltransferase [Saccharospirillum sp. MSK14-1]
MQNHRHTDLDWIRIFAFGVLILYHLGMYYVADWGFHLKSDRPVDALQNLMILTNPWRMSLIFLISAMVLALAQQRLSVGQLIALRSNRLLVPLVFGMVVVVAPQAYLQAVDRGYTDLGFFAFWRLYINPTTHEIPPMQTGLGLLTWNHLWFIPYVWCYSLIVLLLSPLLRRLASRSFMQRLPLSLALVAMLMFTSWIVIELQQRYPATHALFDDWYNHALYFTVFVFGYCLAQNEGWWQRIIQIRLVFLLTAIVCYSLIILDREGQLNRLAPYFPNADLVDWIYAVVEMLNHWSWILAVIGYGGRYLAKPDLPIDRTGRIRRYANEAILPCYVLHQTLMLISAAWLQSVELPLALEALVILSLTVLGCVVGFECLRRFQLSRWLFGLRLKQATAEPRHHRLQSRIATPEPELE